MGDSHSNSSSADSSRKEMWQVNAKDLLLAESPAGPFRDEILPVEPVKVRGYNFNDGTDYHKLLQSFRTSGFQATNFGIAVEEINKMVRQSHTKHSKRIKFS